MSSYFDMVVAKDANGIKRVFQAPPFTLLKEGDSVYIGTGDDRAIYTVVNKIFLHSGEEMDFILSLPCFSAFNDIPKLTGSASFREFEYYEEEEQ